MAKKDLERLISDIAGKQAAPAFETEYTDKADEIRILAKDSKPINDAYGNAFTASGTEDKLKSFDSYGFSNSTLNYPLWIALYNDSWVFRRAIDKPAQDEVNCGFLLKQPVNAKEPIDFAPVYKTFDKYRFDMIQLLSWGALFGGSIAVMMFEGVTDEEMQKPISREKIKGKRMRLYVTDRWYGVSWSNENVTNMRDIDFGSPVSYNVTFADGHMVSNIHHSYVLRYEHRTAPKLIKCGQLQGWGYAEGSHILNELSRDDQIKSSITSLVNKSLIEIVKMSGMRGVFMGADQDNEEQLTKRLEMVNWGRNYNSLTFLDKDDDYQQYQLNVQGLSDLMEENMWLVAAALEMQGVLFGDLKGGLSQESDAMARYAVTIKNRCNSYYRPVLYKLLRIIFIMLGIDATPDFEFKSLVANEDNKAKMEAISSYAQTLNTLCESGIISKYQVAVSLQEYINHDTVDIQISDEQLDRLKYEEQQEILDAYKGGETHDSVPGRGSLGGFGGGGGFGSDDFGEGYGSDDFGEGYGSENDYGGGENPPSGNSAPAPEPNPMNGADEGGE